MLVFKNEVVVSWHFGKALEAMQTMLNRELWLLSVVSNDWSTIMQLVKPDILDNFAIQDVNTVGKRECEYVFFPSLE